MQSVMLLTGVGVFFFARSQMLPDSYAKITCSYWPEDGLLEFIEVLGGNHEREYNERKATNANMPYLRSTNR